MQDHDRRLARLERANRLLLAGLAVTALVAAVAPQEESGPSATQVESLELVDAEGRTRAQLLCEDGAPVLRLLDAEGRARAELFDAAFGTGLYLKDEEGTVRIGVAQFAHGGGGVALHGPGSKGGTVLYHEGTGTLRRYDEEGEVVAEWR